MIDRVIGSVVEHGVSYWLHVRRVRRQRDDVHRICTVGDADGRHSAVDGRTFRVSAHAQTTLVSHKFQRLASIVFAYVSHVQHFSLF